MKPACSLISSVNPFQLIIPMQLLPLNEFRNQIGEYVNQVYYANKAFTLTKGAKPVAVLVPISLLERLATLEKFHEDTLVAQQRAESAGGEIALATAEVDLNQLN